MTGTSLQRHSALLAARSALIVMVLFLMAPQLLTRSAAAQQDSRTKPDYLSDGFLYRTVQGFSGDIQYFLNEVGLTAEQSENIEKQIKNHRQQIASVATERQVRQVRLQTSQVHLTAQEIESIKLKLSELDKKIEVLPNELVNGIDRILLDHQKLRFRQVVVQRYFMEASGLLSFEFPLAFKDQIKLTNRDEPELKRITGEVKTEYLKKQAQLKQESWDGLIKSLPEKLVSQLQQNFDSRLEMTGSLFATPFKLPLGYKWDYFETGSAKQFLEMVCSYPEELAEFGINVESLELSTDQISQMESIQSEYRKQEHELRSVQSSEHLRARKLLTAGKENEAEPIFERLHAEQHEIDHKALARILDSVLLPFQAQIVRRYAKQERLINEFAFGDEFGLPFIVATQGEFSKRELQSIFEKCESAQKELYEQVDKLLSDAEEQVLDSLPLKSKELFEEKFGEFYNYRGEVVQTLAQLRKQRRDEWFDTAND